jgi:hypothetical protein
MEVFKLEVFKWRCSNISLSSRCLVIALLERRGQNAVFCIGISRQVEQVTLCRRILGGVQILPDRQSESRTRRAHPRPEEVGGGRQTQKRE